MFKLKINREEYKEINVGLYYGQRALIAIKEQSDSKTISGYVENHKHFDLREYKQDFDNFKINNDEDYENYVYKYNDNVNFRVIYKYKDKNYVQFFSAESNQIVKVPFLEYDISCYYLIEDPSMYIKIPYEEKELTLEQLKDVLDYDSDYKILQNFNHPIIFDNYGTLRFKSQKLTREEEEWSKDLNKTWHKFYNEEIKINQLLKFYCKIGYSISGYMEVFYDYFTVQKIEIKDQEEIKKMLS